MSACHSDRCLLLIDILEEYGECDKEGNTDDIFNSFDVGVKINQGVNGSDHAAGDQVLSCQLGDLPVDLIEPTYHSSDGPYTKQNSCTANYYSRCFHTFTVHAVLLLWC